MMKEQKKRGAKITQHTALSANGHFNGYFNCLSIIRGTKDFLLQLKV